MEFVEMPSASKQVRSLGWKFQKTFLTPLKALSPFADRIASIGAPKSCTITIHRNVFEPKEWLDVLKRYSLKPTYDSGVAVRCEGAQESRELLGAAFTGWIDFLYVPKPKQFVIYADHDEYTTFYTNTKANLNRLAEAMTELSVSDVVYTRDL
jgi:hypothetical protein